MGSPSAERLHRASKAAPRVCVYTQHDPQRILREAEKTAIHRAGEITLYVPAPTLLQALAERVERAMRWEISRSGGQLYATIENETFEGEITHMALAPR